ncbi:MAG: sulfotransferase family 2 domain-containing protein [Deltaproteobacteria bacterium]|nr:sulfotransferase family 2 domain-containing protein [Deltaproteobacteria bacterium]
MSRMESSEVKEERTVFFQHIPKCAGTTLNIEIFKKRFQPNELRLLYDYNMPEIIDLLKGMSVLEQMKIKCLSGHYYFGIHTYYTARPSFHMTILRNPIERVISHYYQVRRHKPHRLYQIVTENDLSLKEYVNNRLTPELNNGQVRVLAGLSINPPFGECERDILELAKKNLKDSFGIVGLTERFDDFLLLVNAKLGWEIPSYKNLNIGENRKKADEIDKETLDVIEKHNQLDIELYEYAQDLFLKQFAEI